MGLIKALKGLTRPLALAKGLGGNSRLLRCGVKSFIPGLPYYILSSSSFPYTTSDDWAILSCRDLGQIVIQWDARA